MREQGLEGCEGPAKDLERGPELSLKLGPEPVTQSASEHVTPEPPVGLTAAKSAVPQVAARRRSPHPGAVLFAGTPAWLWWSIWCVALLSLTVRVTGADELTSSGSAGAALRLGVPIAMAGMAGLVSERCGVVNIGIEGMMILGTWFGAWAAWQHGPWAGVALGVTAGMIAGLLHALATVTFLVDQVISGVVINLFGAGLARYLSVIAYDSTSGGSAQSSPSIGRQIGTFNVPILAGGSVGNWRSPDLLGRIELRDLPLISDAAGLGGGLLRDVSWLTLVGVATIPALSWVLWSTAFGLRLRSVGENPQAAESLGVPVRRIKYYGVMLSGSLAGLGGAMLPIIGSGKYIENQVGGRGFIGLAATAFGNWMPGGVAAGAGLFGYVDALQLRSNEAVRALLVLAALAAAAIAASRLRNARYRGATVYIIAAGVMTYAYVNTVEIPTPITAVLPHTVTLVVLGLASQRLRPPKALGVPFRPDSV